MKLFNIKLLPFLIVLLISSCSNNEEVIKISPNDFHNSVDKVIEIMVNDIFSPPVASRKSKYCCI